MEEDFRVRDEGSNAFGQIGKLIGWLVDWFVGWLDIEVEMVGIEFMVLSRSKIRIYLISHVSDLFIIHI